MVGGQKGFGMVLTGQILAITGITIHETGMPGKGVRFEIRGFPMEATGKRIPWCDYPVFRFLSLRKYHISDAFRGVILIQGLLCEARVSRKLLGTCLSGQGITLLFRVHPQYFWDMQYPDPHFSKYCWWYSSAIQKSMAGLITVAIGFFPNLPDC